MLGICRASHFHIVPHERCQRFGGWRHGTLAKNHRRNIRPLETWEPDDLRGIAATPLLERDVVELPALVADHRLDFAMQASVCTAGDLNAVLTLRTFEEVRFAHMFEIQWSRSNDKRDSSG